MAKGDVMKLRIVRRVILQAFAGGGALMVTGLVLLALGPGSMSAFEGHGGQFILDRPEAPAKRATSQLARASTAEAEVLANWEFTHDRDDDRRRDRDDDRRRERDDEWRRFEHNRRHFDDTFKDVLKALREANEANQDAAKALFVSDSERKRAFERATRIDQEASRDVLTAYRELLDASRDSHSAALKSDADAMLAVYNKMVADVKAGNFLAVFQDTQTAQNIANKAILDARNASPCR